MRIAPSGQVEAGGTRISTAAASGNMSLHSSPVDSFPTPPEQHTHPIPTVKAPRVHYHKYPKLPLVRTGHLATAPATLIKVDPTAASPCFGSAPGYNNRVEGNSVQGQADDSDEFGLDDRIDDELLNLVATEVEQHAQQAQQSEQQQGFDYIPTLENQHTGSGDQGAYGDSADLDDLVFQPGLTPSLLELADQYDSVEPQENPSAAGSQPSYLDIFENQAHRVRATDETRPAHPHRKRSSTAFKILTELVGPSRISSSRHVPRTRHRHRVVRSEGDIDRGTTTLHRAWRPNARVHAHSSPMPDRAFKRSRLDGMRSDRSASTFSDAQDTTPEPWLEDEDEGQRQAPSLGGALDRNVDVAEFALQDLRKQIRLQVEYWRGKLAEKELQIIRLQQELAMAKAGKKVL